MNMMTTLEAPGAFPKSLEARRQQRLRRMLALFDRTEVEDAVDCLINWLDDHAGDIDLELNGDEADGNCSEDDFMLHSAKGLGCPIADPAEDDDPAGGNILDDPHDDEDADNEPDVPEARRTFRDAIRRERCRKVTATDMYGRPYARRYELIAPFKHAGGRW